MVFGAGRFEASLLSLPGCLDFKLFGKTVSVANNNTWFLCLAHSRRESIPRALTIRLEDCTRHKFWLLERVTKGPLLVSSKCCGYLV